jgi:DNA-binding response OmpR family regulator
MKNILLVCDRANIDTPLRRSLAHLVNSCQVDVVSDGFAAFQELSKQVFNLVVIDFSLNGIDGLELAESVAYIDPDVPVVMMFDQVHRQMWGAARSLNANPILRPFKPLTFLRLVDTLLHQHLERFRELSELMQTILYTLTKQPVTSCAMLVEGDGQMLLSAQNLETEQMRRLARMAAAHMLSDAIPPHEPLLALNDAEKDHNLFVATVLENLLLAVLVPANQNLSTTDDLWVQIDDSAEALRQGVYQHTAASAEFEYASRKTSIPVRLTDERRSPEDAPSPTDDEDDVTVNWAILTSNADTLDRLKNILSQ